MYIIRVERESGTMRYAYSDENMALLRMRQFSAQPTALRVTMEYIHKERRR